jgi:hypothetical protein
MTAPAGGGTTDPLTLLAQRFDRVAQDAESAESVVAAPSTLLDQDRSWITRLVLRLFVSAIGVYLLLLLLQGIVPGASARIAGTAGDMIKTIIVPIVTLVLGYYFGQSGKG